MSEEKEWYRGMTPDFRQYLKTRYVEIRAELKTDLNLEAGERQFLMEKLNEYSSLLRQVMIEEEAAKQ